MYFNQYQQSPGEISPQPFKSANSNVIYNEQSVDQNQSRGQFTSQNNYSNHQQNQQQLGIRNESYPYSRIDPSNQNKKPLQTKQSSSTPIKQFDNQFNESQQLIPSEAVSQQYQTGYNEFQDFGDDQRHEDSNYNNFQSQQFYEYQNCYSSDNEIDYLNLSSQQNSINQTYEDSNWQIPPYEQSRISMNEQIVPNQQFNNTQNISQPYQTVQQQQHGQQQLQEQHESQEWRNQQKQKTQQQQLLNKKTRKINKPRKPIQKLTIHEKQQKYILSYDIKIQKQTDKSKLTEKYLKILRRRAEILGNKNNRFGYGEFVKNIIENLINNHSQKLPQRVSKETIGQITKIISEIKKKIIQSFHFKVKTSQYSNEENYIINIIMLIVKYIIYDRIGSYPYNYKLKDIQWINLMKDDLQYAFLNPKVQKALEFIYRFILNNEDGKERFEKIEWKALVTQQKYLKYQLEFGKNFFTSLHRNYCKYIDDRKLDNPNNNNNFDENFYNLGGQSKKNKTINESEFFCEKYDRSKLYDYVVNHFIKYFLDNHKNVKDRIEEIYLDDIINLIIRSF